MPGWSWKPWITIPSTIVSTTTGVALAGGATAVTVLSGAVVAVALIVSGTYLLHMRFDGRLPQT
jgi:hypothetical protein